MSMSALLAVARCMDNDSLFSSLYREIYYHRLFATSSPTVTQRIDSWCNYCCIFQDLSSELYMQFPNQWLWDLVDEFVNQFQSFCHFKATITQQDMALLKQNHEAWSVLCVLDLLEELIGETSIIPILGQAKDGGLQLLTAAAVEDAPYDHGYSPRSNVSKVLGYFSIVGLLRVHCLLGNYQTALDCLLPIDINQQGFYTSLIGTHITTIFHYGFANIMLGSYVEAISKFNKFLVHIFKTKQPQQNQEILNKIEHMYALLAICLSLCPSQHKLIDEYVNSQLMEKYGEKMSRMQRYDDDVVALYGELLSYAWSAFSTPFAPSSGDPREVFRKFELGCYEAEDLALAYPKFFGPSASSYGKPIVTHNQVEAVISSMLKLKLK